MTHCMSLFPVMGFLQALLNMNEVFSVFFDDDCNLQLSPIHTVPHASNPPRQVTTPHATKFATLCEKKTDPSRKHCSHSVTVQPPSTPILNETVQLDIQKLSTVSSCTGYSHCIHSIVSVSYTHLTLPTKRIV